MRTLPGLMLAAFIAAAPSVGAHFNMLLPASANANKGNSVEFVYQWGHPYEHELFDAPRPEALYVICPDGRRAELLDRLEATKVPAAEGKSVTAYRLRFTPEARGDYTFVLRTPPIWMEEEGEFFRDAVKVVLHVQAQKGWDAACGEPFELVPLTRPYGLEPGMAFQAGLQAQPLDGAVKRPVEIEHFNARPPKTLPPDEQVTRTAKPDRSGVVTGTLTDAGWWCLTAARPGGTRVHDGKERPVLERTTLWVYVDEKPAR